MKNFGDIVIHHNGEIGLSAAKVNDSDGVTADVLAERFGISKEYIYQFAGKGRGLSGASIKVLRTNSDEVKRLLETGMSYAEVGRNFGTSKDVVREFCKENNICRGSNKNGEKDVAKNI